MTEEDLCILFLDTVGWDYDKCLNPRKHNKTKELIAGEVVLSILNNITVERSAKFLDVSYKVLFNVTRDFFVPLFGNSNGGNETWYFHITNAIEYMKCPHCSVYKTYKEYDIDKQNSRGIDYTCKNCKIDENAIQYKKECTQLSHKKSQIKNHDNILQRNIQYKLDRLNRIPKWADLDKIKEIYKNCPSGYHVDHIVPLKGVLVSGLHVHNNLQYLLPIDNIRKGNKYTVV